MSLEDSIISSVIFERMRLLRVSDRDSDETKKIERYGRRMIRMAESNKISPLDSDEQIAEAITPLLAWIFWQISRELLMWVVSAIRRRIWQGE